MDEEAADTLANEGTPEPPASLLPAPIASWTREEAAGGGQGGAPTGGRLWHDELPRWQATLNPGRTTREYEKAVAYFFQTPGVPQYVGDLAFDLLLAYRGALALRATPHAEGAAVPRGPLVSRHASLAAREERVRLAGDPAERSEPLADAADEPPAQRLGALAPATVNLRLTALRQFLVHCALFSLLPPELTPDRIRAALRRLKVERRRPYQILDESEWQLFLAAARMVGTARSNGAAVAGAQQAADVRRAGPWGVPRAARQGQAASAALPGDTHEGQVTQNRSRSGLTGARTAERDHALIALALATGLRSIELASLDVGDIVRERHGDHAAWWLVLPDVKTKGQHGGRTLPLAPDLVETLTAYLAATDRRWERAEDRKTPLFVSGLRGQQRLSLRHIRRIVDRVETQWLALRGAADEIGAADGRLLSPHALRHSTAIALLQGNERQHRPPASVEHVRGWLGHFDIRTTQRYLAHLESREHRRPYALSLEGAGTSAGGEAPASSVENTDARE
jgi:site-specific recombinase XerD